MYNFFAKLSRMKYINRWGLMRNTIKENIAEHSLQTAMITHSLITIGNIYFNKKLDANKACVLAMYHDATEIITGDMPTPIKYYAPEISSAYKKIENIAAQKLINDLPNEMKNEYKEILGIDIKENEMLWKYVKAADKLSAYIKCIEEISMGNKDFIEAKKTIFNALQSLHMEEVDWYINKFVPAYELTVDEQNQS